MNNKLKIIATCTAAIVYCAPVAAFAASPTPAASPKSSPAAKAADTSTTAETATTKVRALPFHGTVSTVEHTAKTFTIAGKEKSRIFKITDTTVITKAGAPATMTDIVANEEVRGSYIKAADGSLEAKTVKLGPKTDEEKAAKPSKKKKKEDDSTSASPSPEPKP